MKRLVTAALLLVLSQSPPAWAYRATVVAVQAGDTLTLDTGQRVRLWGIDAPEEPSPKWARQPGADEARDALAAMAMHQVVEVEPRGRSDGLVAAVVVLPDGRNVSAELVYAGLAWVDPRHCTRKICDFWREGEEAARNARKGLWSRGDAVPPWEWRHKAE